MGAFFGRCSMAGQIFTFNAEQYADHFAREGYVHIPGGVRNMQGK